MANKKKFTREKKHLFLESIKTYGNKSRACREVGINYKTFIKHLETDASFSEDFRLAMEQSGDVLEEEAHRRAVEGVARPVFDNNGQVVGEHVKYSDQLLTMLLKAAKPAKYSDKKQIEVTGTVTHEHMTQAQHSILDKLNKALDQTSAIDSTAIEVDSPEPESLPIIPDRSMRSDQQ